MFVAYPWAPYDRDEYKRTYRALEQKHDVTFEFAEDRLTTEQLMTKIENMMTRADFCIFDFTGFNPNVALEYGMARGLRLEAYVAFNPGDGERDVPSDVRGIDTLRYETLEQLNARLDTFLAQALAPKERERRGIALHAAPDLERFDEELAREPKTDLLRKIESRGHWILRVRPQRFIPGRVEYGNLAGTIADAKVEGSSFTFPHTDTFNQFPQLGADWYGREFDLGFFLEHWRLFESGQFMSVRALPEDWPEKMPNPQEFPPTGTIVGIRGAAAHIGEAVEFAAGLAASLPGTDPVVVTLAALPLKGRRLAAVASREDPFIEHQLQNRTTQMTEFRIERTVPRVELKQRWEKTHVRQEVLQAWRPLALELMRAFFERFGWSPDEARLRRYAGW